MKKVSSNKYVHLNKAISANASNGRLVKFTPQESQPTPICISFKNLKRRSASRGRFFPSSQDSVEPEAYGSIVCGKCKSIQEVSYKQHSTWNMLRIKVNESRNNNKPSTFIY